MEPQVKTPVQIVQELLALQATRLEAAERLKDKFAEGDVPLLTTAHQQSEKFTGELMNELSNYGDAVLSSVDSENAYQQQWTSALANLDTTDKQQAASLFQSLEKTLAGVYAQYLHAKNDLPDTLQQLLTQQAEKLPTA